MPSAPYWLGPAVHPVYARLVYAELLRQGLTATQLQTDSALDWQRLLHDNHFLNLNQLQTLLLQAVALSGQPWLGFAVGMHTDVSAHGPAGYAAVTASTLKEGILLSERYASLRQHLARFRLESVEPPVLVLDELKVPDTLREYLLGHFVTGMLRLLETLGGQPLQQRIGIDWPLARPDWWTEVEGYAARWRFGSDALRIHLPQGLLQQPCLGADADACAQALRDCEHQLDRQQRGGSMSERIKLRLLRCEPPYPTLVELAAQENLSARTLIRHLHSEGTRYQVLLDDLRSEQATWLLLHSELSMERIAERLGYQDTSNFSRTFRRWHGCAPRDYRLRHQSQQVPTAG